MTKGKKTMTYKTLHRKLTPLKPRAELSCSVGVGGSCSACGTRRVTLVANPMKSHI
jgi:hypothetical protein